MIILNTLTTAQTISVIPREYSDSFTMTVRNDSTKIIKQYDITSATTLNNYLNFDNIFNPVLVKNHYFDLKLYIDYNFWNTNYTFWNDYEVKWNTDDGQKLDIYNDKVFCTDQDINQLNNNDYYQLNKGQYTEYKGFDNTYTVP